MKQLCVFFGNCQAGNISKFLKEFTNFGDFYDEEIFANWMMLNPQNINIQPTERSIDFFNIIQKADLIIYQPLRDEHGCFSSNPENPDSFIKLLKPGCKLLSFPRLCCQYFFPIINKKQNSCLFYGNVLNCPETLEELTKMYDEGRIEFDIKERMEKNYTIGKKKEEKTDVKIVDFIYSNISKRRIFHTQDHPTTIIYTEIIRQIANLLDLKYEFAKFIKIANENDNYAEHIDSIYYRNDKQYPFSNYVIKALELQFAEPETFETKAFYKSILTHWFLTKKGILLEYPMIQTMSQGVAFLQIT